MRPESVISKKRAGMLFKALRDHLAQDEAGQEVIAAFEANPNGADEALAAYLRHRLPEDTALAHVLSRALGDSEGAFTTVVTGGEVDKIVNIARLGVLNLTVRRYFNFFTSVAQVLAFVGTVTAVVGTVAYFTWRSTLPDVMTGDFNIAVAEFAETGRASLDVRIAPAVSQRIFSFLEGQYQLSSFEDVQVAHSKIGVIHSAEEAKALAQRINADVVIYGDVTVLDDQARIAPRIYVAKSHRANVGEVGGQHQLNAPIDFSVVELLQSSGEGIGSVEQRAAVLVEFTKALVYLAADDLVLGSEAIESALAQSEPLGDFEGKEVLYLFASEMARRRGDFEAAQLPLDEALRLNETYGRAYIARANVYYDQGNLFQARTFYERALVMEDQPFGAYITEKASLGLGHTCSVQYQHVRRTVGSTDSAAVELANCALTNYQRVIDSYSNQNDPEQGLVDMTAWAYYGAGIIYQEAGQPETARPLYEQALGLSDDPDLVERAQRRLSEVQDA